MAPLLQDPKVLNKGWIKDNWQSCCLKTVQGSVLPKPWGGFAIPRVLWWLAPDVYIRHNWSNLILGANFCNRSLCPGRFFRTVSHKTCLKKFSWWVREIQREHKIFPLEQRKRFQKIHTYFLSCCIEVNGGLDPLFNIYLVHLFKNFVNSFFRSIFILW